jgi:hypothetical protein
LTLSGKFYEMSGSSLVATANFAAIPVTGSATYTYSGAGQGPTVTTSGDGAYVVYSQTYRGRGSTTYDETTNRPINAGTYYFSAELRRGGETVGKLVDYAFEITKKDISFTVTGVSGKVYDTTYDATGRHSISWVGTVGGAGGTPTLGTDYAIVSAVYSGRDVGDWTITAIINLDNTVKMGNYNVTNGSLTATSDDTAAITRATVAPSEAKATITYGQGRPTTVTAYGLTRDGSPEVMQLTITAWGNPAPGVNPTYSDGGDGLGKAYSNITYTTSNGNYNGSVNLTLILTVLKAELTYSADSASSEKVYDGTNTGTASAVLSGMVLSDSLVAGVDYTVSAVYNDVNAGDSVAMTVTVTLLDTAKARNYKIAEAGNTPTGYGRITKRLLTVSAGNAAAKAYDGEVNGAIVDITFGNYIEALTEGVDYSYVATYESKDNGTRRITTVVTLKNSAIANNYKLSDEGDPTSATATSTGEITRKGITATLTVSDYVYDGTGNTAVKAAYITISFSGVVPGEVFSLGREYALRDIRYASANAGTWTATGSVVLINLLQGGGFSYAFNYRFETDVMNVGRQDVETQAQILKAPVQGGANGTITYGDLKPGVAEARGLNGEVITGTIDWSGTAYGGSAYDLMRVGGYSATVAFTPTGGASVWTNYDVTGIAYELTVIPKTLEIRITVSGSVTYDGNNHYDLISYAITSGVNDGIDVLAAIELKVIEAYYDNGFYGIVDENGIIKAMTYKVVYGVNAGYAGIDNYAIADTAGYIVIDKAKAEFTLERGEDYLGVKSVATALKPNGYDAIWSHNEDGEVTRGIDDTAEVNKYRNYSVKITLLGDDGINYEVVEPEASKAYASFLIAAAKNVGEAAGVLLIAYLLLIVLGNAIRAKKAYLAAKAASDAARAAYYEAESRRITGLKEVDLKVVKGTKPYPKAEETRIYKKANVPNEAREVNIDLVSRVRKDNLQPNLQKKADVTRPKRKW